MKLHKVKRNEETENKKGELNLSKQKVGIAETFKTKTQVIPSRPLNGIKSVFRSIEHCNSEYEVAICYCCHMLYIPDSCICIGIFPGEIPDSCICIGIFPGEIPDSCICIGIFPGETPNQFNCYIM